MIKLLQPLQWALAMCILVAHSFAFAAAMKEIEDASAEAREAMAAAASAAAERPQSALPHENAPNNARLEAALKRGEEINVSLQSQVESLKAERAQLVQVQTALTSGLIGAVVTALVAIGGAIVSSRNSKPERDLKRLAVLEKAHELQSAGVQLPNDIAQAYVTHRTEG